MGSSSTITVSIDFFNSVSLYFERFIFPDIIPGEQDISANNFNSSNYEDYYDL